MKALKRLFILLLLAGAIVAGFVLGRKHGGQIEKAKRESATTAASARQAVQNAVNTGKRVAGELGANLAEAGREGAKKAGELATNVVAHTKTAASKAANKVCDVTTNLMNEARKKLEDARN